MYWGRLEDMLVLTSMVMPMSLMLAPMVMVMLLMMLLRVLVMMMTMMMLMMLKIMLVMVMRMIITLRGIGELHKNLQQHEPLQKRWILALGARIGCNLHGILVSRARIWCNLQKDSGLQIANLLCFFVPPRTSSW